MKDPETIYDYDPRNLPTELLTAIGLAITSGSQTESILNMAVGGTLGLDSALTIAVTVHMPIPLKISVLKSAAEFRLEVSQLDELDRILDQLKSAIDKRNGFAHDNWMRDKKTGVIFRQKETSRVRLDVKSVPSTVDEIRVEAGEIYGAGMALMTFLYLNGLLPPIPETHVPREHKSPSARKRLRKEARSE